ncbi:hypothetical protein Acr_06g0013230 [Actinidia rufa]|uniref:WRKY19-like zinc finger domain-containing protein n=1 Tax=Actinidia rufa TaxID=165716 RepID=A0A7J0ESH3_9ERIC|nr:hypothetical protein Acr_06g0013230 [Actinidia rufa]
MNPNENGVLLCNGELAKNNYGDTTLRLECFGYGGSISAGFGVAQTNPRNRPIPSNAPDDGCRLVLGLGPTLNSYSDNYHAGWAGKSKGLAPVVHQRQLSEGDSILKLGLSGGTDEVSYLFDFSVSTESNPKAPPPHHPNQVSVDGNRLLIPVVDEGSTSAKKSGGLYAISRSALSPRLQLLGHCLIVEPAILRNARLRVVQKLHGRQVFCIGHGGGQRCQRPGCNKGAESRTAYCKAHGGGKRCEHLGCTKSAEGRTDYCIAHGGGRRCGHPAGCTKAARGSSGLCIKHGGGKRCKVEGCTRSAEGQVGLCISHGGGRRCQLLGCTKGAQGSTMFCKAHGGGKRCIFAGCTKGAEGSTPLCKGHGGGKRCLFDGGGICPKSVHGGTNFCVAHGGGKRCAVAGCTKSARGRTDCCVKHGGGKRCKFENCGKSAQGSTDFCKAHGGGKRCNWGGEGKCEKFARGKRGLCAAHSSMVQERETNKGGMIGPNLFHGLVSGSSTGVSSFENNYSSSGASVASDSIDSLEMAAKRHLIPPQVLVPLSMKCSSSYSRPLSSEKQGEVSKGGGCVADGARRSFDFVVTEGRVHGGGLMSLLVGNLNNAIDRI